MTETISPAEPGGGEPELSGVDLARAALHQARAAARKRGDSNGRALRPGRPTAVRREGREPAGFAAVLQHLMAERAWEVPAAGGSVLDQWPDIAADVSPSLPGHVQAVAFDPQTGRLDLRPDSPAYGTQLRLITAQLVAAANRAAGTEVVRTVRVLPVGPSVFRSTESAAASCAAVVEVPFETRETASDGYQRALAAHRAAAPARHVDAGIAQAVERQTRALRALSRRAFPEPEVAALVDQPALIETTRDQRRREGAAVHAAALRRARAERGSTSGAPAQGPASASAHSSNSQKRK